MVVVQAYTRTGIPLEDFLNDPTKLGEIRNKRVLYILKANSHRAVFKFGIAGFAPHISTDAKQRLKSYVIQHGKHSNLNRCSGVRLFYLEASSKNKYVQKTKSQIYRRENMLKTGLDRFMIPDRGVERVTAPWRRIAAILKSRTYKKIKDSATKVRRSQRK